MVIPAVVLSGFALALAAPGLHRLLGRRSGWAFALLPAAITAYLATLVEPVAAGELSRVEWSWVPSLGVSLSFQVDGLGLVFALLIAGIGILVLIYSAGYLGDKPQAGRFYAYLLMFMASMLGLVLADNVFALIIFWELTSLSSFLLIGFHHDREDSRAAAWQALIVTAGGGLALLAGLIFLGIAGGSFEFSELRARGEVVRAHHLYLPILILVLVGAATKSAQFPFHFWLPAAMTAPTPVSVYLHSATMVKAGVYLLARLHPVLGGTEEWCGSVAAVGAVTMVVGGVLSVASNDLKRILAYSTVSALGALVLLLGLGGSRAVEAMVVFLVAHALYKGALFMVAGAVDHETGTRDIRELGGLRHAMPITATIAIIAGLTLASLLPSLSFIGKEMLFESAWESGEGWSFALVPATVLAGAMFVVVAGLVVLRPFFGPPRAERESVHEPSASLWLGSAVLAVAGVLLGFWPEFVSRFLVSPATASILGTPADVKLALWHGINPALVLSLIAVGLGVAVYVLREPLGRALRGMSGLLHYGPEAWYRGAIEALNGVAHTCTAILQNGYLRHYIFTILAVAVGLFGYALLDRPWVVTPGGSPGLRFYEIGLLAVIVLAAVTAVVVPSYLAAIAALGVVGYCVALVFVLFGAPDLAMTQFLIETFVLILFLLVFARRKRSPDLSSRAARVRDAILATAVGAMMTAFVLVATTQRFSPPISGYFTERSVPDGHGRNVVNVILVDFRVLDTLGEITVLATAGVGVYALWRLRSWRNASGMAMEEPGEQKTNSLVPDSSPVLQPTSPEEERS